VGDKEDKEEGKHMYPISISSFFSTHPYLFFMYPFPSAYSLPGSVFYVYDSNT